MALSFSSEVPPHTFHESQAIFHQLISCAGFMEVRALAALLCPWVIRSWLTVSFRFGAVGVPESLRTASLLLPAVAAGDEDAELATSSLFASLSLGPVISPHSVQ
jgi:hypothetical protein